MQTENKSESSANFSIDYFIDLENSGFQHLQIFHTVQKTKPWETLTKIPDYMKTFFTNKNKTQMKGEIIGLAYVDEQNVYVGEGTVIEHGAMIKGPCIIGKNCQIRKGAYLRGNVIIGDNVVIGNSCEVKNSIIFNGCEIPHFNYIGDSILGTKVHVSAGALTSNFRLDGKEVNVVVQEGKVVGTGMVKFGALIGDRAQVGCNVVLNPGSMIGKDSWIYPNLSFRGFLESHKILKLKQQQVIETKR